MKILIIGGSGFIGRHLANSLFENQHEVTITSRTPSKARKLLGKKYSYAQWDGITPGQLIPHLENSDAVVNLAGENIGKLKRWTKSWKNTLLDSRIVPGKALATAILEANNKPDALIQSSAIGYYGTKADSLAGEEREAGEGFLARLTYLWEESVAPLKASSTRIAYIRTGIVLDKDSPLLSRLRLPLMLGLGVVPGNGRQWISWIHMRDHINAICFLIENPRASGPFNLTSPEPVSMGQMIKVMGRILKRPLRIKIPGGMIRLALGEMARETILASQDALPEALLDAGFSFEYANIDKALTDILGE